MTVFDAEATTLTTDRMVETVMAGIPDTKLNATPPIADKVPSLYPLRTYPLLAVFHERTRPMT
jgi:hypothetical protein